MGMPPGPAPGGYAQPGAPPMNAAPGGEVRGDFSGTGGELLGQLLLGFLLMFVTMGIYAPWFVCKLNNFVAERITYGPTQKGMVRCKFEGTGGQLFVHMFVGGLLMMVTFGIYVPWYICRMTKFFADSTTATTDDGSVYKLRFDGSGGDFFVTYLVGAILTGITFGIYMPWFYCKMQKWFAENTKLTLNGQDAGSMTFVGQGGELFVTYLVGAILTGITMGIYGFWFAVKIQKFNNDNTKFNIEGRAFSLRFTGTGGELFGIMFVGMLLCMVTLGIYYFWMLTKLLKWQLSNTVVVPDASAGAMAGMGGGGMVQQMGPPGGQYAPPQQQFGGPPQQQQQLGGPPMGGPPMGGPPMGGPPMGGPPPNNYA